MTHGPAQFITQTYQQPYRRTVDPYKAFIRALAEKFTRSPEEATAAICEMESDIKHCAETDAGTKSVEDHLNAVIAWRRLLKFLK